MALFGTVSNPTKYASTGGSGLFSLISNIFSFITVIAGIIFTFQIIMAGYSYMTASGDSKKIEAAWAKIWQAALGLVIVAAAYAIAGLIGRLLGIKIFNPTIYGPQ